METFNTDPKPGRLILPLVLIGMIATTYTFINRVATNNSIELVSDDTTTTVVETAEAEETTTTSTTSSSWLDINELLEFGGPGLENTSTKFAKSSINS